MQTFSYLHPVQELQELGCLVKEDHLVREYQMQQLFLVGSKIQSKLEATLPSTGQLSLLLSVLRNCWVEAN